MSNLSPAVARKGAPPKPDGPKRVGRAYVLLFLFGGLGLHRFYLRRTASACVMLGLCLASYLVLGIFWPAPTSELAGLIGLAVIVWEIIDLFLIPRMTRAVNQRIRAAKAEAQRTPSSRRP